MIYFSSGSSIAAGFDQSGKYIYKKIFWGQRSIIMYSTPSLSTALSCLKCKDGVDIIYTVLMRIKALFNLVRSLRSEASWRNAAMERRPRAAISQIFQWTLILIQLSENDEREQLSTLSEEVPAVHKAHTLISSPWEVPGKTATNAITTTTTTTEPEFQEAYFSWQDFMAMTHG